MKTDPNRKTDRYWFWVTNATIVLGIALMAVLLGALNNAEGTRFYLLSGLVLALFLFVLLLHMRQRFVSEREQSHEVLLSQKAYTEATFHSLVDAVITTDASGHVNYMNQSAEDLTGWENTKARGKPIQVVFHITEEDSSVLLNPIAQCLSEGHVVRLCAPVKLMRHGEAESIVEVTASPMRNRKGELINAALVFHDVSKERQMQDRIAYQQNHDALTGLINRREFENLLAQVLQSATDEDRHHALCYMDIDYFKIINDICGYAAGDELLVQLSALLLTTVRGDDLLARLGGDEFAVLLFDCPLDEAANKARVLRDVVKDFRFVWEGRIFDVSCGFGVVAVDASFANPSEIFRAADSACYAAKSRGRNKIYVYKPDDPELQKIRGEMRWVTRIGDALRNQEFQLYYQKIESIQVPEPNVFHCELLMRTEGDQHELVSPEAFIPSAERYNLMADIDRWVISTALPKIAELDAQAPEGRKNLCAINLSGQSLGDESFYEYVNGLMKRHHVNPASLCFEITETAAIANLESAIKFIRDMKARGCSFALDDFGTGMSSFTYLKQFPLDYVKIDGSFIRKMQNSPVDLAMVESVVRIAQVMGIKTIAEFVEDQETIDKLKGLGVDYAQGYGIAKPQPL